jgi:hypothetical protein
MGCCAERKDFCIPAGATFAPVVRWGMSLLAAKPITAIAALTPVSITAVGHGAPQGWPVAVVGAQGMYQMNASRYPPLPSDMHYATVVDANTIALNDVSADNFSPYTSGGELVYQTPVPLAGVTATMSFYDDPEMDDTPLLTLTSGSDISIDAVNCTIIPLLQTVGLLWTSAFYKLECNQAGVITRVLQGILTLE